MAKIDKSTFKKKLVDAGCSSKEAEIHRELYYTLLEGVDSDINAVNKNFVNVEKTFMHVNTNFDNIDKSFKNVHDRFGNVEKKINDNDEGIRQIMINMKESTVNEIKEIIATRTRNSIFLAVGVVTLLLSVTGILSKAMGYS